MSVHSVPTLEYYVSIDFKEPLSEAQSDEVWNVISKYSNYSELEPYSLMMEGFKDESDAEQFEKRFTEKFRNLIK